MDKGRGPAAFPWGLQGSHDPAELSQVGQNRQTCTDLDNPSGWRPTRSLPQEACLYHEAARRLISPLDEVRSLGTRDTPSVPGFPSGTASGSVLGAHPSGPNVGPEAGHGTAKDAQGGTLILFFPGWGMHFSDLFT